MVRKAEICLKKKPPRAQKFHYFCYENRNNFFYCFWHNKQMDGHICLLGHIKFFTVIFSSENNGIFVLRVIFFFRQISKFLPELFLYHSKAIVFLSGKLKQ